MIKVNIKNKLSKERDLSKKDISEMDGVEGLKLLLESNSNEEREILKNAGLDHSIQRIETVKGIDLERSKIENRMEEQLFTYDEIKNLCINYNLRFLQSKHYKGTIEPVLGAKILNFFRSKKIDGSNYEASQHLFIMAPEEMFNLKEMKVSPHVKKDPAIFYRIETKEGSMFCLIHKWGNDFTVFRRLKAIVKQNWLNYILYHSFLKFFLVTSFMTALKFEHSISGLVWLGVGIVVVQLVTYLWQNVSDSYNDRQREKQKNYDLKFSENNWNSNEIHKKNP